MTDAPGDDTTFGDLLDRLRDGDPAARSELIGREMARLRAFIRLKTGAAVRARESCSDLVQSVCREALEDIDVAEFPSPAAFRQWLFQVALNKIRRRAEYWGAMRRDLAREQPGGDEDGLSMTYASLGTPSRHASAREVVERIESAMDQLSEEHRDVIIQARILGRSHKEIAAETGRSEEAVRQLLARARAKLGLLLN